MSNSTSSQSKLDMAIDQFERNWTVRSIELLETFLPSAQIESRQDFLTELVRVDIDKRYSIGCEVRLADYFDRFSDLLLSAEHSQAIAYEDFRARFSRGLPCTPERWSIIPAVESRSWYIEALKLMDGKRMPVGGRESLSIAFDKSLSERSSQSANDREFPEVGRVLGDFELLALLGSGAFSQVYLARQLSLSGRYVAVKVVARPLREPANLARLQHTGIVPLYSFHQVAPWWLLCMPYNGSATLADWLKTERVPGSRTGESLVSTIRNVQDRVTHVSTLAESAANLPSTRDSRAWLRSWNSVNAQPLEKLRGLNSEQFPIWFFRRTCSALAHAHQRGIVHGDLKPANILIRSDGEPALIDFNLSHAVDTETEAWLGGTLPYMAPEQLDSYLCRSPINTLPAVDVYALGTILYEMVEGSLPYPAPASAASSDLAAAIEHRRRSLPVFRSRTRLGLVAIISKCLEFDVSNRYPSAMELFEDVEQESESKRLRHCREHFWFSRIPKFVARHPRAFSVGSVSVLSIIVVGLITAALLGYRERAMRLLAVETLARFKLISDSALAGYMVADEARDDQQSARVQSALEIYGLDEPSRVQNWKPSKTIVYLNAHERSTVAQRLLAIAFLSTLDDTQAGPGDEVKGNSLALSKCARLVHPYSSSIDRYLASHDRQSLEPLRIAGDPLDRLLYMCGLVSLRQFSDAHQHLPSLEVSGSLEAVYWMTLGRAQLGGGSLRESIVSFSIATRLMPQVSTCYINRGLAKFHLRDYTGARNDFAIALLHDPKSIPALANRHFASTALGDYEGALNDLDQILKLSPTSNRALVMRARTLKQLGRHDESNQALQLALQSAPRDVADWVSLGLIRLPDDPANALNDLEQAEKKFGSDPMILQSMAHVYSEYLHDLPRAIASLDRLLVSRPMFSKALSGRAVLHARSGEIEESLKDIRKLESNPAAMTAETHYQVACAYAICSKPRPDLMSPALRHLAKAVKQDYGGELMQSDKDLDALRDHHEFRMIQEYWILTKK